MLSSSETRLERSTDLEPPQAIPPGFWKPYGYLATFAVRYLRGPNHPSKLRLFRILGQFLFDSGVPLLASTGGKFLADPSQFLELSVLRTGGYEPRTLKLMQRLLEEGGTYVDVGANVGLHLAYLSPISGVTPIAVEPHPKNFDRLKKTAKINSIPLSSIYNVAIDKKPGEVYIEDICWKNSGAARVNVDEEGGVPVKAVRLETLLEEEEIGPPKVLKVDVEGYELPVLKGLDWEGPHRPEHIIIELLPHSERLLGENCSSIIDFLERKGYQGYSVVEKKISECTTLPENNAWFVDSTKD